MQQCGCSCELGEKSQINKFLSRKLIIQPGLRAWIIYSGKLWALCMERAARCDWVERFVRSSRNRNVIKTTPTPSHNSWTWKCISSAFFETPRRGQVLHVGEARSWHLTFDIFSSFAEQLCPVRDRLEYAFYSWKRLLHNKHHDSLPIPHLHGDCAVNGTNVCQKDVSLASSNRFQAPQWQSTPNKIEFDSGVNFSAVMIEMSRALCARAKIFNKTLDSNPFVRRCVVENFWKGNFSPRKPFFHRSRRGEFKHA